MTWRLKHVWRNGNELRHHPLPCPWTAIFPTIVLSVWSENDVRRNSSYSVLWNHGGCQAEVTIPFLPTSVSLVIPFDLTIFSLVWMDMLWVLQYLHLWPNCSLTGGKSLFLLSYPFSSLKSKGVGPYLPYLIRIWGGGIRKCAQNVLDMQGKGTTYHRLSTYLTGML